MGDAERAIATITPGTRALYAAEDPNEIIERAVARANALARVIENKHLYIQIGEGKHILVEGWTMLATLHNLSPVVTWSRRLETGDGWEARVEVYAPDGGLRGGAEAQCDRSERKWADREDHALRSMAETRATAKALRLPLGYVVALAGYEATPAEEMPEARAEGGAHWCGEHKTHWFKRGKMKNFAHPVGESGEWCNEPVGKAPQAPERPPQPTGGQASAKTEAPPAEDINDLLAESGLTLQQAGQRASAHFKQPSLTFAKMTLEQRAWVIMDLQSVIAAHHAGVTGQGPDPEDDPFV